MSDTAVDHTDLFTLNQDFFTQMRKDMHGGSINWLINIFLNELPVYLDELQQAITTNDSNLLHLKSCAAATRRTA